MLDMNEIRELIHLLDETSLDEIRIEHEELKVHLKKHAASAVAPTLHQATPAVVQTTQPVVSQPVNPVQSPSSAGDSASSTSESDDGLHVVPSPMVGTFYRSPSPDSPSFVDIGSKVTDKSILCIVEAMKLMNEIEAEVTGEVVDILAKNGELVEYGQPLFKIRLS